MDTEPQASKKLRVLPDIDANINEADWAKRHWDLPDHANAFSYEDLLRMSKLPVWKAAPPAIKNALLRHQKIAEFEGRAAQRQRRSRPVPPRQ